MYTWVIITKDGSRYAIDAYTCIDAQNNFEIEHPDLEVVSVLELENY